MTGNWGRTKTTPYALITLSLLSIAALLGGCPGTTTPPPEQGVTDVRMQNIAFSPAEVTIHQGEKVRWTNLDFVPHTTTSGNPGDADAGALWNSGLLPRGQSFEHTFDTVGEFVYFCEVHPTIMRDAKVTVVP